MIQPAESKHTHQFHLQTASSSSRRRKFKSVFLVVSALVVLIFLVMSFNSREEETFVRSSSGQPETGEPVSSASRPHLSTPVSGIPMRYRIGEVDPRFNISTNELRQLVENATAVWERPAATSLFVYDPSALFAINLIFDERQEKLLEERRLRTKIDGRGNAYDVLKQEYDAKLELKNQLEREYESDLAIYDRQVQVHNSMITYWNNQGGAPPGERSRLEEERKALEEKKERLEEKQQLLNDTIARVRSLAGTLNSVVAQKNADISVYKDRFLQPREFEKGQFDGREINIYEYNNNDDLTLALVHELGHALGFGHVDDPQAIMYYKLEQQDLDNIHLADADIKLLNDKINR